MNWIDIIVLIPLCWYAFRGFKNGFLMEIVSLAALFLGLFISYKFSDLISFWITGTTLAKPISFSLCFILTIVLVNLLGRILKRALKPVLSEFLDKGLGVLFGILKVVLVAGVLFYFIDTVDKNETYSHLVVEREVQDSVCRPMEIYALVPLSHRYMATCQKHQLTMCYPTAQP